MCTLRTQKNRHFDVHLNFGYVYLLNKYGYICSIVFSKDTLCFISIECLYTVVHSEVHMDILVTLFGSSHILICARIL